MKFIPFSDLIKLYDDTAKFLINELGLIPDAAVVAGSGIDKSIDPAKIINRIPYDKIPGMPRSSVEGHKNEILLAGYGSKKVLFFSGRFHLYEGKPLQEVCSPAIISHKTGIKNIILTNAAGGLNKEYNVTDIMLIRDSINFTSRFIRHDLSHIFNKQAIRFSESLSRTIAEKLTEKSIPFREGTYTCVSGPSYETPAEIRMYRKFADAIGMSTYHEAQAAYLAGMNIAGCSLITNKLTDTATSELSHDEVLDAAEAAKNKFSSFLDAAIEAV